MKRIAIVMPAYNAGQTIEKVFARIPAAVLAQSPMFIVINDGSTDDTRQALARIAAHYANVEVIEQPVNKGYAQAQKAGFTRALERGAEIVALLHSDGQYAPEHLPLLLEPLASDQCDVVVGSRILGGQARAGGHAPLQVRGEHRHLPRGELLLRPALHGVPHRLHALLPPCAARH
jgi:glycosyltransferase involved in cell wall biosynthesis